MAVYNNSFSSNLLNIYNKNSDAITIVFQYGLLNNVNISVTDQNGNNLLHLLVKNNDNKTLSLVLNYINIINPAMKSMLNIQNNSGDTPMHIAARNGNEFAASILHRAGSLLNIRNKNGESIENSEERENNNDSMDALHYNEFGPTIQVTKKTNCDRTSEELLQNLRNSINLNTRKETELPVLVATLYGGEDILDIKLVDIAKNGGSISNKLSTTAPSMLFGGSVESDKLHHEVIDFFQNITKNEDDARALKAALYSLVKEKFPDKNGLERAQQMIEYLKDKKIIDEIKNKLDEYRLIIKNAREVKEQTSKKDNKSQPKEIETKEKKSRAKKSKVDKTE